MNDQSLSTVCLVERNHAPGGVKLVDSKAVARRAPEDLVVLAQEIQKADEFVRATTSGKLQVIVEQVRHLQEMAHRILQEARDSTQLHHAACNFRKVPGKIYHLYQRTSGQTYFSMLSPKEWGSSSPPHEFLGSYRLEYDMTWTPEDKTTCRDSEMKVIDTLLGVSHLDTLLSNNQQSKPAAILGSNFSAPS